MNFGDGLRSRWIRPALGAALAAFVVWRLAGPAGGDWIPSAEREPFSGGYSLLALDGSPASLDDHESGGRVVFLNVWATWCPPCRAEMPSMDALNDELAGEDFAMVAVATGESPPQVRRFVRDAGLGFEVLCDPNRSLASRYRIHSIPTTLVLDKEGRVALFHVGARDWSEPAVVENLRRLMAE